GRERGATTGGSDAFSGGSGDAAGSKSIAQERWRSMTMTTVSNQIPFIDLPAQFRRLKPEIDRALEPIFESTGFILGPSVAEFEEAFAKYLDGQYCVTLNSGTAALHLALLALGIGPGDEVITVANSFIATAEAISFAGATRASSMRTRSRTIWIRRNSKQ